MNNFIEKIKLIEKSIAYKYGTFHLFCIVELEDNQGQWDIVASADWLPASESKAAEIIIDYIYDSFDKNDLQHLGRVIILRSDEPFVNRISEIGRYQLSDIEINGLSIKRLYVISSQPFRSRQERLNLTIKNQVVLTAYEEKRIYEERRY